jgi:hypothetical protein
MKIKYKKDGLRHITPCPFSQTGSQVDGINYVIKVGSEFCEKYCKLIYHDKENQIVDCGYNKK